MLDRLRTKFLKSEASALDIVEDAVGIWTSGVEAGDVHQARPEVRKKELTPKFFGYTNHCVDICVPLMAPVFPFLQWWNSRRNCWRLGFLS